MGAEAVAAGGQAGHTIILLQDGTVRGVGDSFSYQTGSPAPAPNPQGTQTYPATACGLRLKQPFQIGLDCPSGEVIAGEEYTVSWAALGIGTYRVEIDGIEQVTTDQSITLSEPDTLASPIQESFRARLDDGCGESAWTPPLPRDHRAGLHRAAGQRSRHVVPGPRALRRGVRDQLLRPHGGQ